MSKVLLVEDNELNMKLFYDLLTIQKHEVIVSKDGLDVLNITKKEKPQLILMDIQIGEISGIDLIKQLKEDTATKDIPIIAITAFAMKRDVTTISKSGCDMYISKPVSIDNFFEAVNKFVKLNHLKET
jgi:two-component system, cell cycle response regulator DivK